MHHIALIRHGYASKLEQCVLLCPNHHSMLHLEYDMYLDELHETGETVDWREVYNKIKQEMQTKEGLL